MDKSDLTNAEMAAELEKVRRYDSAAVQWDLAAEQKRRPKQRDYYEKRAAFCRVAHQRKWGQ